MRSGMHIPNPLMRDVILCCLPLVVAAEQNISGHGQAHANIRYRHAAVIMGHPRHLHQIPPACFQCKRSFICDIWQCLRLAGESLQHYMTVTSSDRGSKTCCRLDMAQDVKCYENVHIGTERVFNTKSAFHTVSPQPLII